MSHGGVREPASGPITEGDDVNLARAVPEIDVIIGGHTHTFMRTPVIVNGTPVVQAGCYGQAVGELVVRIEGRDRKVLSYDLRTVDDTIPGNPDSQGNENIRGRDVAHRIRAARPQDGRADCGDRPRLDEHILRPRCLATAR